MWLFQKDRLNYVEVDGWGEEAQTWRMIFAVMILVGPGCFSLQCLYWILSIFCSAGSRRQSQANTLTFDVSQDAQILFGCPVSTEVESTDCSWNIMTNPIVFWRVATSIPLVMALQHALELGPSQYKFTLQLGFGSWIMQAAKGATEVSPLVPSAHHPSGQHSSHTF